MVKGCTALHLFRLRQHLQQHQQANIPKPSSMEVEPEQNDPPSPATHAQTFTRLPTAASTHNPWTQNYTSLTHQLLT